MSYYICLFLLSCSLCYSNDLLPRMSSSIEALQGGQSYQFFDLSFTDEECELFDAIQITRAKTFDQYGNLERLPELLPAYLEAIGNRDQAVIEAVTKAVYRIATTVVEAAGKESAWVTLRASLPHHGFDTARWHTDGNYFAPKNVWSASLSLQQPSKALQRSFANFPTS